MAKKLMGHWSSAAVRAREYYNSTSADRFYFSIWGGEDIHIGIYETSGEPIASASRRTVRHLAARCRALRPDARVLDLGSGYGGAARYLAQDHVCRVECLDLAETHNARNRHVTQQAGLSEQIGITEGSFEDIPFADAVFDAVWSQDAFVHSGARAKVIAEVARVLRSGGEFVFTDIMQEEEVPPGVLQPVLDRISLESLGSIDFYRTAATEAGLSDRGFEDLSPHMTMHYARVLEELESRRNEMVELCGQDYVDRMQRGLRYWIDAGEQNYLRWGSFLFSKP